MSIMISIDFDDYVLARSTILLVTQGKSLEAAAMYVKGNCPLPPLDVVRMWQEAADRVTFGDEVVIVQKISLNLTTCEAETTCQKIRHKSNYELN